MGTTAARKAKMILENTRRVLGLELFAAYQALTFRGPEKLAPATKAVYDYIAELVPPVKEDIIMYPQMERFNQMLKENAIADAAQAAIGPLR